MYFDTYRLRYTLPCVEHHLLYLYRCGVYRKLSPPRLEAMVTQTSLDDLTDHLSQYCQRTTTHVRAIS
jgi:hypothetical protein